MRLKNQISFFTNYMIMRIYIILYLQKLNYQTF